MRAKAGTNVICSVIMMKKFSIVEFDDGLSVVPSIWLEEINVGMHAIWPNHLKNQLSINKAIINEKVPQNGTQWSIVNVCRKFGEAGYYPFSLLIYR